MRITLAINLNAKPKNLWFLGRLLIFKRTWLMCMAPTCLLETGKMLGAFKLTSSLTNSVSEEDEVDEMGEEAVAMNMSRH